MGTVTIERPSINAGSYGEGGGLPPVTAVGDYDNGDRRDWEEWESELTIDESTIGVSALSNMHPIETDELHLTQALLNDGWSDRYERVKEATARFRGYLGSAVVGDYYRVSSPFDDFPPPVTQR